MSGTLEQILAQDDPSAPRLGAIQLERLRQLGRHYQDVVCWDGIGALPALAIAIVVLDAVHAARVEAFIASLDENSIVILPYGENPAFDHLKSRLHAHGSIGAQGVDAPHLVWWGGVKPPAVRTGMYRKEDTLFLSSFEAGGAAAAHAETLAGDMARLGLDYALQSVTLDARSATQASAKVDFIIRQWTESCRPVFWIDPQARLGQHPLLPQAVGCDLAVHRQANGAMTPGALFFHQTEAARAFLDIWQRLTLSHPNLPESFLLDQAWTLASSQRQIETAWLPDTYWHADQSNARSGVIVASAEPSAIEVDPLAQFAMPMQCGRRFGRYQAPEAHLVMKAPSVGRGPITVAVRDVLAASARDVGEAVEAAARDFAVNPGGFSQMEVVLCGWNEDVDAVLRIEDYSWVLMTDPSERLDADAFKALSVSGGKNHLRRSPPTAPGDLELAEPSVLRLIDPALGARLKRSGRYRNSFVMRPDAAAEG